MKLFDLLGRSAWEILYALFGLRQVVRAVGLTVDARVRYVMVGGISAGMFCVLFAAGWCLLGDTVPYLLIATVAHLAVAAVVFPLHKRFVFQIEMSWRTGFLRFYPAFGCGFAGSIAGIVLLVDIGGMPVVGAQLTVLVVFTVLGYLVQRYWVFRQGRAKRRVVNTINRKGGCE